MAEYWRDLKLGEEIQIGDRCLGANEEWFTINDFRKTINRELNRGLSDYKPDELARVLARLSVTADRLVIFESEFQARKEL